MIYNDFDLSDLSAIARLHPVNRRVAEIKFNDLIGDKILLINRIGLNIAYNSTFSMNIGDMDAMYSALKSFGHLFTNLTINYDSFGEWESGKINARLSKYLGNWLVEITLKRFHDAHFKHLTGTFTRVENIHFEECYFRTLITNLPTTFPAVRKFQFETYQNGESLQGFINHHFPCLDEINEIKYGNFAEKLETALKLNPQIRKLTIQSVYWQFLKLISETMPQLKQLKVHTLWHSKADGNIHFKQLKSFDLSHTRDFPDDLKQLPISFGDDVEEINDWTRENYLLNVILQNKQLKKVGINGPVRIHERVPFKQIAQQLPNLEEFRVGEFWGNAEDVVQFIEMAKNLKKFELRHCEPRYHNAVSELIQSEWEMFNGSYSRNAIFIRRQSSDRNHSI